MTQALTVYVSQAEYDFLRDLGHSLCPTGDPKEFFAVRAVALLIAREMEQARYQRALAQSRLPPA